MHVIFEVLSLYGSVNNNALVTGIETSQLQIALGQYVIVV